MIFGRVQNNFVLIASILILFIVLGFYGIGASAEPISGIIHFPVKNAVEGQKVVIEARIEDPNIQVQYMRLYYRYKGQSNFQFLDMTEQLNSYAIEIPGSEVLMPGIEYFIMAVLMNRAMITSPASNPYYSPYEITVTPGQQPVAEQPKPGMDNRQIFQQTTSGAEIETLILSPEPGERVARDEIVIAVSYLGDVDQLNLKLMKLYVDNNDVSTGAKITKNMISYIPPKLNSGTHQIRLELIDIQGNRLDDVAWNFSSFSRGEKISRKGKKSAHSGNIYAEYKSENFSDSTLTNSNLGANFRGKFGAIQYRGNAFITSRENPGFQPRNRFLLDVGTSWIGIRLGDTTPRFNELMLWGKRVRGFEAYLKLGFINFEFIQGQTNRRVRGIPYDKLIDPVTGQVRYIMPGSDPNTPNYITSTTGIYRYGTFQQNLSAGRLSFGRGKNFQFGLNLVKVRDDTSSGTFGSQPKDNLVIGPDILFALDNHRIELKASAAFSLLANDISSGAISQADLDSALGDIPFDPSDYEDYFILNTSLIPLDPSQLNSLAYQASFKFNYFKNNIHVIYKSIGSEYFSLANSYIRKDIKGYSIYDRIQLYRNQIFLNLGMDKYLEGLSFEDDEAATTEPTDYSALNIGVSFFPRQRNLPRININWKNFDRNDGLDTTINTSAVNYRNSDVSVQLGYDMHFLDLNHTLSIGYIGTDRVDGFNRTRANLANNIQMISLRTVHHIPLTTIISFASNRNNAAGGIYDFKYSMINLAGSYDLLNRRLNIKGGLNMTSAVTKTSLDTNTGTQLPEPITTEDYKRLALNFGGNFQITGQHSLLLDMSLINFNDKNGKKFNDSIIRFRYEFRY